MPCSTIDVTSRGKHVLHRLDLGLTLHTHLRMEGSWRLARTDAVTRRESADRGVRVRAASPTWTALGLRLGLVEVWPTGEERRRLGYLGPDILGADWDLDRVVAAIRRGGVLDGSASPADVPGPGPRTAAALAPHPSRTLGESLLDQRVLAGLGTMWTSEALFAARLSPWSPAGAATEPALAVLLERTQRLMRQAVASGIQTATGRTRRGELTNVHGRSGRPCNRCGDVIRIAPIGPPLRERVLTYCPTCQGGLAPTDDGARQHPLGSAPRARGRPRTSGRSTPAPGREPRGRS